MYYACCNFDVAVSTSKRALRRWAKKQRFAGHAQFGWINSQTLASPRAFQQQFGPCLLQALDQGLKWSASLFPAEQWADERPL